MHPLQARDARTERTVAVWAALIVVIGTAARYALAFILAGAVIVLGALMVVL